MVYCRKCARLLDEDVRFCPYCNNEDENFTDNADLMDKLQKIDDKIAEQAESANVNPPDTMESSDFSTVTDHPITVDPEDVVETTQVNGPAYAKPVFAARSSAPRPAVSTDRPTTALYVCMILLSIFLSLPGLIVGIVFMTNRSEHYRKLGLIMLIISLVFMFMGSSSCCALINLLGAY